MGITHFPNGVSSFGVPVMGGGNLIPQTTGDYFFVDDSGSSSNDGLDPDHPLDTMDNGNNACTADHGDVVILMPGHAESETAMALDTAGVTFVGLGFGEAMPTITATTAAADLVNVTADSVVIRNICFTGGASGTTALIDVSADGDYFMLDGCRLVSGAAAPVDLITLATGSDNVTIINNTFLGAGSALDNFILAEGYVANLIVKDNYFDAQSASGIDEAAIQFALCGSGPVWIDGNTFMCADDGDALLLQVSENDKCMLVSRNLGVVADLTDIWVQVTYEQACFAQNQIGEPGYRTASGSGQVPTGSVAA